MAAMWPPLRVKTTSTPSRLSISAISSPPCAMTSSIVRAPFPYRFLHRSRAASAVYTGRPTASYLYRAARGICSATPHKMIGYDTPVGDGSGRARRGCRRGKRVREMQRYQDRVDAGRALARRLAEYAHRPSVLVMALPRGGVPVAFEVARALGAPLDVFVVRKLGVPGHEELAMGAIASGDVRVLNDEVIRQLDIPQNAIEAVAARERQELERRERSYRGNRPALDVRERTVVIVDDGLATGSTMRAAVRALQRMNPRQIIVAVPVAARDTCAEFRREADQ